MIGPVTISVGNHVFDFAAVIESLKAENDPRSPLARIIGSKGYHAEAFAEGPYPIG
jgi:UDP-glucose 4-epimerase